MINVLPRGSPPTRDGPAQAQTALPETAAAVLDSVDPGRTTAQVEADLLRLKDRIALDAQRETLTSSISSTYHRTGMSIIANMKA